MKNKIIPIILVSLSCILFIIAIFLMFNFNQSNINTENNQNDISNNQNNNQESSNTNNNTENNNVENENVTPGSTNEETEHTVIPETNQSTTEEPKPSPSATTPQPETTSKQETDVIAYFEQQDNMIVGNINQDDRTFREKVKDSFVTVIDFIFYNKEVKGYTFQELTTTAKLKIIKLALSIDHKIDEYFPDYKEVIKDKYTNIKGKLAVKYLEFTATLCEKVGTDTCNQAKEDFNNMKNSFHITWELIKELASSGSSKVKEFYESWRDSE